jgi:hypothetical protein
MTFSTELRARGGIRSRSRSPALLVALVLSVGPCAPAAARTVLRGEIRNGTTLGPGSADKVTLFKLQSGMVPVANLGAVTSAFELATELEQGERYLLQVTHQEVNYNELVDSSAGGEIRVRFTVYEVSRQLSDLTIETAHFFIQRDHDRLHIEKVYMVNNRSAPPRTIYDPEGSFRFRLPPDLVEMHSVSATAGSGMPVPQPAFPLPDGSAHATRTAFKPGPTEVTVAYDVSYATAAYRLKETVPEALGQVHVLVTPADIGIRAEGWEKLSSDPAGKFAVLRRAGLPAGSDIDLSFSGGSEHLTEEPADGQEAAPAHGQTTALPEPERARLWILVCLMAAALAYGLLTALGPAAPAGRRTPSSAGELAQGSLPGASRASGDLR